MATATKTSKSNNAKCAGPAMNPLPSLLRASAWDSANTQMRSAGRSKWSRADYNLACGTQERLVRACYGRETDGQGSPLCYIRFQLAETLQKSGDFTLWSDMSTINDIIDASLTACAEAA